MYEWQHYKQHGDSNANIWITADASMPLSPIDSHTSNIRSTRFPFKHILKMANKSQYKKCQFKKSNI